VARAKQKYVGAILVGAAKEEVNPPADVARMIYPRKVPYTGVESDLYARAAVFGAAGSDQAAAALVVIDTLYVHPEIAAAIRERAARTVPGLRPQAVMVAATHTHSAPPLIPFDMGGGGWEGRTVLERGETRQAPGDTLAHPDPEYIEKVKSAGALAIARAWAARHDVRGRVGLAEARLGHNRRIVGPDGVATNEWVDPAGRHTGYFNPNIRFVVFEDAHGGQVRSVIAGYGCHPVSWGPGGAKPSPDYPGYFARRLEAATGAETALHVTTGGGDINPRKALLDTPTETRAMGEALAAAVLAAIDGAQPLELTPLSAAQAPLELRLRAEMGKGPARLLLGRTAPGQQTVATEVQALRLGDLALVSAPGELFAEIAATLENISPVAHTIVVGHANDALGYLFTDSAIHVGGYEVVKGSCCETAEQPFLAAALKALAGCGQS
jgi:hypothetical protein